MFAIRRGRFPLVPLLLAVAFGYLLAGSGASALGAVFLLPLLLLKMAAVFFLFAMMLRFVGGGRDRAWSSGHPGCRRVDDRVNDRADHRTGSRAEETGSGSEPDPQDDRDWEEALRAAKREIDKLFPNPRE
jgi:hypothetical protein